MARFDAGNLSSPQPSIRFWQNTPVEAECLEYFWPKYSLAEELTGYSARPGTDTGQLGSQRGSEGVFAAKILRALSTSRQILARSQQSDVRQE